ncbi:MAG: hypothetical protein ACK4M9_21080 [Anaerobacillus sp.]|uniref:hypothetical protein n=1 Tax=Anaerobacillus sp. TaxID=1872506 RepID=UPI00391D52C8
MKQWKSKVLLFLLIASLGLNVFMFGNWSLYKEPFIPTAEEKVILSEMVKKTIDSEDYISLAEKENIISIDATVDKFKGGVFPFYLNVVVKTDKQTYLFFCTDKQCSNVKNEGWAYSIYEDESPRLPLKVK